MFAVRSQRHPLVLREARAEASDADLVTRYRAGDPGAFAELVRRYTGAVFNLNYRFTADRAEAENLTQETFLRAWNALPRLALDRPLKQYLLRIALNLCRDWADKNHGFVIQSLDADDEQSKLPSDEGGLDRLSEAELAQQVRAHLEQLPPMYRAVITLRYTEGLSYEELAEALDLPLNTVRTHLSRAKARLRELLVVDKP